MKLRPSGGRVWPPILVLGVYAILAACGNSRAPGRQNSPKGNLPPPEAQIPELELASLPPEHEVTARVSIKTSMGDVVIGLFGNDAPRTVENFLTYVDRGFYGGTICHRVIIGFMVQCGGFDAELNRAQTDEPIKLELIPGLKHEPGIVSMARTSNPHSASSQFFICVGNAPQLNGGYAIFGKVEEGYEIVEAMSKVETKTVETERGPMVDVPSTPIVLKSVKRL